MSETGKTHMEMTVKHSETQSFRTLKETIEAEKEMSSLPKWKRNEDSWIPAGQPGPEGCCVLLCGSEVREGKTLLIFFYGLILITRGQKPEVKPARNWTGPRMIVQVRTVNWPITWKANDLWARFKESEENVLEED